MKRTELVIGFSCIKSSASMMYLIKMQGDVVEKIRAAKCIECKNSDI